MKKKVVSLLAAMALAVTALAGCGSNDAATTGTDAATVAATTEAAGTTEATGTTEAATDSEAVTGVKAGFIFLHDENSTYDLNFLNAAKAACEKLGIEYMTKTNIPEGQEAYEAACELADAGCNFIFADSFGHEDYIIEAAKEYPNVQFSHATGTKAHTEGLDNFHNAFASIYDGRYLAGIVAGMKTESNLIGYVSAMGSENSECTGGIDAFAMGVYSVNPDAKVYVKVTNSWYSPTEETNAAKALLSEGCDVIAQHCDTPNPQLEAESAGKWGVGYNTDMSKDAPKATLTSTLWNWSAYYTYQVKQIVDGNWKCENYYGGMADGLVDIAPLNKDLCTEDMQKAVDEAKAKLEDGSFNVFDGVIETNDGKTVGEEGKTLDDATITGGINWYFKNVEVK